MISEDINCRSCALVGECVRVHAHLPSPPYLCCYNYDQGNHHHQTPVATVHSQSLPFFFFFSCFMSEKEGIRENGNDSSFQPLCPQVSSITGFKSKGGMWRVGVKGIILWKLMSNDKNKFLKDRAPFDAERALIPTVLALVGTSTEKWKPWLFRPLDTYPRKCCWNQLPGMLQVSAIGSAKDAICSETPSTDLLASWPAQSRVRLQPLIQPDCPHPVPRANFTLRWLR